MTFYYEQKIGTWGQANSIVTVWMAGENQPLRKFIDLQTYTFKSDNANSAYRTIWIGPFSLGRTANASYPTARTWIYEFIISTQPIAAPLVSSSSIRSPASGSGDRNSLHVLPHAMGAKIFTLSFPNAARKADLTIHDLRGNLVKRFAEVRSNRIKWNASETRSGVYVVEARIGSQRLSRSISILNCQGREAPRRNKENSLTEAGAMVKGRGDSPNQHDILTGSHADGTAYPAGQDRTCANWTSESTGSAIVGRHDRHGVAGNIDSTSWNEAHASSGCSQSALVGTGGNGYFYCFAAGNSVGIRDGGLKPLRRGDLSWPGRVPGQPGVPLRAGDRPRRRSARARHPGRGPPRDVRGKEGRRGP